MAKYIIDKKVKIICKHCGAKNEPFIFVDGSNVSSNHMRPCRSCGGLMAYDINYVQKEPIKLLQEIRSEEDILKEIK